MTRYFFDIKIGSELAEDEDGVLLANLEDVQREAARTLADLARDLTGPVALAVEVRDEVGPVMRAELKVHFVRTN